MVAAALWLNAFPPYVGVLSSRIGDSDLSVFMAMIVGGAAYWLLAYKAIQVETLGAKVSRS